ncbi:SpoIIE family protein phosphatase [bacterium]|nr:SpoIIE family protein phosphatase [bacterium]
MKSSILILNSIILSLCILAGHALAQTHPIDREYIKEWLVLGPFFSADLETDFPADVGGEANIPPKEGDIVTTTEETTLAWKRYTAKGNIIDLFHAVGKYENATAYAFCVLQSEVGGDAEIYLGNVGGIVVWINDKRVHSNPGGGRVVLDWNLCEVDLRAGANRCLVKLSQGRSHWGFAMRADLLPPNRAVISGVVTDETGQPMPNAAVHLEEDDTDIAQERTDASGNYRLDIYPVLGPYDLSAAAGEKGNWHFGIRLREKERRTLSLKLKEAISIEGTLLMLDNATPHVAVPVQAMRNGKVVATTLSDGGGKYRFINLKPGQYQVRCQVLGGYVYYRTADDVLRLTFHDSAMREDLGDILKVEESKSLKGINFHFAPFKKGTWKNYNYRDGLASNTVDSIYRDPDGMMWFGGGGVSQYNGKNFVHFTTKDGLASNDVRDIYGAPDGTLWFGTFGGVSRYNGKEFENFTTKDGLASNIVNSIYRSPDGTMWFGTGWFEAAGGISRYDGKRFVNFTTKDGLANNMVFSIYGASDGILWFGTWGSGVSRYDGKMFVNFTTKDGLAGNDVFAIHGDPDGTIWFGVWARGVSQYDGKEFRNFTTKDGLASNNIAAIYRDPDGALWFGTRGGGVSRYDGKEFRNFNTKDGLANDHVWAIHRDPDGTMWFGTEGGVSRYDGKTFVLAGKSASAIHRDAGGMMWFGGRGVYLYDGITWMSLDTRDGLAGDRVYSIHEDEDGSLWFGTDGGITRYRRSTTLPKVRIISMKTDKEYTNLQTIPPITTGNRVTIKYSAIDFKTVPEKRLYRYRIKGIDADWRFPTKETSFDDSFNKPGTYTFEVQAIDRDLNYSEPASLTLKVMLPFYMRAGFLVPTAGGGTILLVALAVSLIFLFKRHRQVRAYERAAVQELRDANQVQMSLMPETSPEIEGVEIAGKCLPANTVSGDFFDYLEGKNPNEIGLVVADITGKAMKGAMNAVMADGVLRATAKAQKQLSPASLMAEINDVLKVSMEWGMNVTMVIATISADTKTLTLANAAHHAYPLLLRGGEVQILKGGGLPLGMRAGIEYTEEQFSLESGDVIILMTDGIIEAQNTKEQLYSDSGRLEETISQFTHNLSAEAMVDAIIADAIDFGGHKTTRDDDMTVVVAKVL